MPVPGVTWARPPGRTTKRKRPDTNFDIAIDTDSQADRFKRQNIDDDNDSVDLIPSHRIADVLRSASTESTATASTREPQPSLLPAALLGVQSFQIAPRPSRSQHFSSMTSRQFRPTRYPTLPSEPQSSKQSTSGPKLQSSRRSTLGSEPKYSKQSTSPPEFTSLKKSALAPEPQSSNLPTSPSTHPCSIPDFEALSADNQLDKSNDESKTIQKWDPKEWDEIEFDSDEENMSLAVTMKLANELSLLKSFLEIYRKFNIHLGDIVSGPRHKGFLFLISSTVARLESHTTQLRTLRNEKQRGNFTPSTMEIIAEKIARKCKTRRRYLWDIMEEKVDMTNDVARATWVKKKKAVLGDVMGGMVGCSEELGEEEGWKEREVGEMGERWEKRWKAYGAMDKDELKKAGWILDVGTRDV